MTEKEKYVDIEGKFKELNYFAYGSSGELVLIGENNQKKTIKNVIDIEIENLKTVGNIEAGTKGGLSQISYLFLKTDDSRIKCQLKDVEKNGEVFRFVKCRRE